MSFKREDNQIKIERTFDAVPSKVYDAYVTQDQFEAWFHPEGWTTTVKAFDPKPNGHVHYGMFGDDITSYGVSIYETLERPNQLVYRDYFANEKGEINPDIPPMKVALEFHDAGDGKTRLVSTTTLKDAATAKQLVDMGVEQGMHSTWNNLDRLLAKA
ncbi:SRPBCC family protein [Staphylococcus massiliensis]|uniref:SRPBCC family protein n=1 Tax=Staphylococcus massiliensis TaxID=555791 RepID=UPI001EE09907|nr:SRPBCC domain-containing protein [Staphylococcus massiliensis]MCG3399285.1 SRPBCC domain-containing protein [Staphylococcus massiliensis]